MQAPGRRPWSACPRLCAQTQQKDIQSTVRLESLTLRGCNRGCDQGWEALRHSRTDPDKRIWSITKSHSIHEMMKIIATKTKSEIKCSISFLALPTWRKETQGWFTSPIRIKGINISGASTDNLIMASSCIYRGEQQHPKRALHRHIEQSAEIFLLAKLSKRCNCRRQNIE